MGTILVTGPSGMIAGALVKSLVKAGKHKVVTMGRNEADLGVDYDFVQGEFNNLDDLNKLDEYDIDVLIHLAAVTGGCSEIDGMVVNVEGTRRLMCYLIEKGCKKFVMASSIAVIGIQSPESRPLQLPIPDDHPCAYDGSYGFSKYMMEEVTRYYVQQNDDIDVIDIRLAAVIPDGPTEPYTPRPNHAWSIGYVARMFLSDAVRVFATAAEAPHKPGVRIMNAAATKMNVEPNVPEMIRAWYPDTDLDLSHYEQPGHECDSLFDISLIREELGFVPNADPSSTEE